jgi:hypothetical protein
MNQYMGLVDIQGQSCSILETSSPLQVVVEEFVQLLFTIGFRRIISDFVVVNDEAGTVFQSVRLSAISTSKLQQQEGPPFCCLTQSFRVLDAVITVCAGRKLITV